MCGSPGVQLCLSIHPRYCPWSPRCVFVGAEWGAVVVGLCPCDPGILVRPPWRFCISSGRSSPDHGYWGTIGDRRLLTNTAFLTGLVYAAKGEWDASIAAYQQALARAPDPYETALVLGGLGDTYREQGKVAEAIPLLEQAVQDAQQYRSRQVQSWFFTFLGKAYGAQGRIAEARHWICQGLALATTIAHPWGIGLAQRALGWLALVSEACAEAEQALHDALHTFSSIHCRIEIGRTHLDLAALASLQRNLDTAIEHLRTANAWFKILQVPKWIERTEHLAHEYGVTLVEVALEEVTDGET